MKTTVQTLFIDSTEYVVPGGMTDKEFTALCALLLRFRRVGQVYSSDYDHSFPFQDKEYVSVRLATHEIYGTQSAAKEARDAKNVEIEAAKAAAEAVS